ncbi:MAG: PilZ domain-containing protein [Candidatus Sericytochromatia bacterium]|nr:PilZ domain-containing protein [Candidatus Tanganyikabacteria bacterium]
MRREKIEVVSVREDQQIPGDRRKAPRASCEYTAEFVDPGTGLTVRGTVLDISQCGMRVRTMGPVRLRETENLRFYVWVNGSLLKLSGSIARQTLEGHLGVEFKIAGDSLKDRVQHTVREAAHRNLKMELRSTFVEDIPQPEEPTRRTVARSYMRGGAGIHESYAAAKALEQSVARKWIDRRIASHLND